MEPEYIKAIELSREVPSHSYLAGLPVVRALQERKRLSFSSAATFFLGGERNRKIHAVGGNCRGVRF